MTARILVVDDIVANVRLLEARLGAEYFDVVTAGSGAEALEALVRSPFDLVLLDVMMPGLDGFEVCRRIKADPRLCHIPVVMVTALDQAADRIRGLEAGADDFLTKPVSDTALITRVKSLVRLKMLTDELHLRGAAGRLGFDEPVRLEDPAGGPGRVLLVDSRRQSAERMVEMLAAEHETEVEARPEEALFRAAEGAFDLVVVDIRLEGADALRLCSQLRSLERTRFLPILLVTEPEDGPRLMRGLDLGVNDYLVRPVDPHELLARVRTQVRRKRYNDRLRDNVMLSMEMAVMDSLTGLHNRRYLDMQLGPLVAHAVQRERELAVLVIDVDHFKEVNDTHGHDAGDDVLREVSKRLRRSIRGIDLACRHGGEEFVIAMPDTSIEDAGVVAERIRDRIAAEPFRIAGGSHAMTVTVSVGVASVIWPDDTPETLLKRADLALYRAKHAGRNRVVSDAA